MRWVFDITRRFKQRPHYDPTDMDNECEDLVTSFLRTQRGEVSYPVTTDDLRVLIEQHVEYLDVFADLGEEGPEVQGVTYFRPGKQPIVKVSRDLGEETWRENRLRTTLTHEFGHVRFHSFLYVTEAESLPLFGDDAGKPKGPRCHREDIVRPRERTDWMEWQAGYASGSFLMPRGAVRSLLGPPAAVPAQPAAPMAAALIETVRQAFAVSADAARVRLSQLGYIARQETLLPL
jgi:hypothetical protein